jgi:lysine/ornithine N-monooxygenase
MSSITHELHVRANTTRDFLLSTTHPVVDVIGIGAGIHNTLAFAQIRRQLPDASLLLIDDTNSVGGVFSRLKSDYRLENSFFETVSCYTCEDVCNHIEKTLYEYFIQLLLDNRVVSVTRDGNHAKYCVTTDSGIMVYCHSVVVGTGYEQANDHMFDAETQAFLKQDRNSIQSVDRLMWNVGRMHRYRNRHTFDLNAKSIAVIGGGCSSQYALSELMRVNKAHHSTIYWIRGKANNGLKVYKEGTQVHALQGYVYHISTCANGYDVKITDNERTRTLHNVDFIVLATGYKKVLYHKILEDLQGIDQEMQIDTVNQLHTKDGTYENVFFVGTTITWENIQVLLHNTYSVADKVSQTLI